MGAFGFNSTTEEVLEGIDLGGKRILITGVSAGLGVETARAMLAHGANVIGAARDLAKARAASANFPAGPATFELVEIDLASLASVRAGADALLARGEPFDVIIANAGIMACPFATTADGFESQFGTNHLGHFVLVNRLSPLLREGGRVVVLSSHGHRLSDVSLDDPNFERTPYDPLAAYGRAKTANILFAVEYDRRHRGRGVRATALHPGGIRTELTRSVTPESLQRMREISAERAKKAGTAPQGLKSVEQGAATTLWAAFIAPADSIGGRYCSDCAVGATLDEAGVGEVEAYALDPERAKAFWARSEELVEETF